MNANTMKLLTHSFGTDLIAIEGLQLCSYQVSRALVITALHVTLIYACGI